MSSSVATEDRRRLLVIVTKLITVIGQISPNKRIRIRFVLLDIDDSLFFLTEMLNHALCQIKNFSLIIIKIILSALRLNNNGNKEKMNTILLYGD